MMKKTRSIFAVLTIAATALLPAQTPQPAPPAIASPAAGAAAPAAAPGSNTAGDTLQLLRAAQAANDEILRKQAVTIQQLEELERTIEQIKIYSKRG